MSERGPIVCATDLGRTGARAVELAARMAAATGRALQIVHVTGPGPELVGDDEVTEAERVLRERLRARLEAASRALELERERAEGFGPHAEAELLEGRAWEQVVEHATRRSASLLVVGPHGEAGPAASSRGALREWILGSTADRIVRHAPCPVLVGPRDETAFAPLGRGKWLVAIDFSEPSRAALRAADELARACDAELVPIHVEPGLEEARPGQVLRFHDEAHARRDELRALVKEVLGREIEVHLAFGEPADSIAVAAEQLGAVLIAMGSRGRTGLAHLLLGGTAERTLRRAHVPVLCVRP